MTEVVCVVRLVDDLCPCSVVRRYLDDVALISLRSCSESGATAYSYCRTKVVEVALDGIDVCWLAEVDCNVLAGIACLGAPVCHEVLIDSILCSIILECRRNLYTLLV